MTSVLSHRGPDHAGFVFVSREGNSVAAEGDAVSLPAGFLPEIAMGFRRLSIIDLSPAAGQPMCNEDGTMWLIFNGEIYNYQQLMAELKSEGHRFHSRSDSEVILHAYEQWGADCVKRFNGMWAFAIWDSRRRSLFCSRDRFGVKPLYYFWNHTTFCLASEPKGILQSGLVPPKPNRPYLFRFLTDSVSHDGEDSFYEGIQSLLPAHCLMLEKGSLRQFRYWDYGRPARSQHYDSSRPEDALQELLIDAVRVRLRSDVPLGACLSGGLDSSSLVGIAAQLLGPGPLDTFSAVFEHKKNDESGYMRLMAEASKTRSHVIRVSARELAEVMPRLVWHLDGPCLSASTYPFWKVCELARQGVKVLLDGQGADELLGGYLGFYPACIIDSVRRARRGRSLAALFAAGKLLTEAVKRAGWRQLYFLYRDYSAFGRRFQLHRRYLLTEAVIHPDWRGSARAPGGHSSVSAPRKFEDELSQVLYENHSRSNLPGLLHYGDGISMAHSLEARLPFLDYRLVEFCFALPPETKIRATTTKWLLRKAMRGIIPDPILDRRDKIGFATPFATWVRTDLRDFVMDTLGGRSVREHGVFDPKVLHRVLRRHLSGRLDMSYYLWRWLTTQLWLDQLKDGDRPLEHPGRTIPCIRSKEPLTCVLPS